MNSLKILFVMQGKLAYGGIETITIELWKRFIRDGHRVDFVCHGYDIGLLENSILESGSKIYHIPAKSSNLLKTIKEFTKIIKEENYDVVHANMNATSGMYLKIPKKNGVKCLVSHSHSTDIRAVTNNWLHIIVNKIEMFRTRRYANLKLACSKEAGKWLYGNQSFEIIYNGIDTSRYFYCKEIGENTRKSLGISKDEYLISHIASFWPVKNHQFVLRMFKKLIQKNNKYKLLLAGDGQELELCKELAANLNVKDRVLFLGYRSDINALLNASDLFILPSHSEGNPVSLVEACVNGLPCIVSQYVPIDIKQYFDDKQILINNVGENEQCYDQWVDSILDKPSRFFIDNDKMKRNLDIQFMYKKLLSLYFKTLKEKDT